MGTFWEVQKTEEKECDLLFGQKDEFPGQLMGNHLKEVDINFRTNGVVEKA